MDKSPDAFRTISEVADFLDTPAHVLRFWESRFAQIKPVKRAGGRRYYRPSDVALLAGIKRLLHDEGLTIRGVQKILRDHGVRHVAGLSDDSVPVENLVASPPTPDATLADVNDAGDALSPSAPGVEEVPEAGFIAIEDEDDAVSMPAPAAAAQSVLPLFEVAASSMAPPPLHRAALREDASFASIIRALPRKSLVKSAPEVATLARRLAALRAQMANRAEGGQG